MYCLQGDPRLVKLFSLMRYVPGISYLRALAIVARLPGDVELDITRGALDDGSAVAEVRSRPAPSLVSSIRAGFPVLVHHVNSTAAC